MEEEKTKFCKHCGQIIPEDAIICAKCGRQVEELKKSSDEQIIINNTTSNVVILGHPKNKLVSFFLCLILGILGAHKFYEGKTGIGLLYLFTCGLFGIGVLFDLISLIFKPNPYYV